MSNSQVNEGLILLIINVLSILAFIVPGYFAWIHVAPNSFGGGICFLIVWGIYTYIGNFVAAGIIAIIAGLMGENV